MLLLCKFCSQLGIIKKMKNSTLSVYFSGTSHEIENNETLAGMLHTTTLIDGEHAKMGFNGCGIEFGRSGEFFGMGLEEQCDQVVENVLGMLSIGKRVRLNAYGHSRGAVACLLLAKKLGKFDPDLLEINLVLMDPVPGNSISSATLDFTQRTLARQTWDVSDCHNLKRVLALYPHEPLPAWKCHAPIIPQYPSHCAVTEEIIPGRHSGAQHTRPDTLNGINNASKITFSMVTQFLVNLGTTFSFLEYPLSPAEEEGVRNRQLSLYSKAFDVQQQKKFNLTRPCHAKSSVAIKTAWPARYLNQTHKKLFLQAHNDVLDEKSSEQRDYAYFFARKKTSACVAPSHSPAPEITLAEKIVLFANFLKQIYTDGMTNVSRHTDKGMLLCDALDELQEPETFRDEIQLKDVMRNVLAICLQRDRNRLSPCSMTRSGMKAKELLNSEKYRAIANLILNTDDKIVRYRDLRTFVLGRNDERFFKAQRSQATYQFFRPDILNLGHPKLLANNMHFYLKL